MHPALLSSWHTAQLRRCTYKQGCRKVGKSEGAGGLGASSNRKPFKKHMLGAEGTKSQKGEPELSLLSLVKFRYCKKAKNFEKISNLFLKLLSNIKFFWPSQNN